MSRALRLARDEYRDRDERPDPATEASDQGCEAASAIDRHEGCYLRVPWPDLDRLIEGIAPADVWFLAAFSGQGKTTFLTSALDRWFTAGRRIYMLGLESRPYVIRTHWACKRLDLDAGDLLTGAVHRMPNGASIRAAAKAEVLRLSHDPDAVARVRIAPVAAVDVAALAIAAEEAKDFGADVVIVDHIDHIRAGDGKNGFAESQAVQHALLALAQRYELRFLVATQLNNDAVRGDPLAMYRPPRAEMVFMGGVKRQIASGMIGLYRPLRSLAAGETPKEFEAASSRVKRGEAEPHTMLTPGCMGVVVMKHRARGAAEGRRCTLGVQRGRVVELPSRDTDDSLSPYERRGAA